MYIHVRAMPTAYSFAETQQSTLPAQGEEVQSISTGNREATGARAGRPEPEEDEEEEKEEEKEVRGFKTFAQSRGQKPPWVFTTLPCCRYLELSRIVAECHARCTPTQEPEEGEEGEEGEGGEPKEPPPPPPAPKVDPYEFKERDVIYLDVPDLPAEVRLGLHLGKRSLNWRKGNGALGRAATREGVINTVSAGPSPGVAVLGVALEPRCRSHLHTDLNDKHVHARRCAPWCCWSPTTTRRTASRACAPCAAAWLTSATARRRCPAARRQWPRRRRRRSRAWRRRPTRSGCWQTTACCPSMRTTRPPRRWAGMVPGCRMHGPLIHHRNKGWTAFCCFGCMRSVPSNNTLFPTPSPSLLLLLPSNPPRPIQTQVALMKLYKEYADSAFNVFRGAGVDNVAAFIGQEPDTIINQLKAYLEATKKQKAAEAAAAAAAEESGEEITADPKPHVWRFRALGLNFGGDSLEAIEHDLKNLFAFDGDLAPGAARDSDTSRSSFPNGDTYFGSYADDVKHGPGLYAFATGAGYAGEYAGGKRHGRGVMVFPDGGTYVGEFVADKFEGQGQYRYPDGSVYTGSWAAGQKHGPGVYWDTARGCLRGEWKKGLLVGKGTYEQPALRFEGEFVRGMPAGTATYTLTGHRTLDMPCFAAQHIQAEEGPTLALPCAYGIPPGSGDEPQLDEEGQPIEVRARGRER